MTEEYTFGRGEECDYCFENHSHGKKLPQYLALSKTHFRVYRVSQRVVSWAPPPPFVGGSGLRARLGYMYVGDDDDGWVWSDSGPGGVHVLLWLFDHSWNLICRRKINQSISYLFKIKGMRSALFSIIFFIIIMHMYMYIHTSALMGHSSMEKR